MDDQTHERPLPPGWLEALADGEADIAAGRIVPASEIHRMLRDTLERMERRDREAERRG